jgi:tripartite ATP-independent transporter DctP family solute receptor
MKRRYAIAVLALAVVMLSIAAIAQPAAAAEIRERTIRVAHCLPRDSNFDVGSTKFGEILYDASGGKIRVQTFPADLSADEVELAEMVQAGNLDIAWLSTGSLSAFVKDLLLLDMPFLFRDTAHVNQVVTGPIGEQILAGFEGTGIKAITFHEDGWRQITNNRGPINTLADLKDLRIRIMMNEMNADMYRALGAMPTPLPWGELFISLQTGLVHGQDNGVIVSHPAGLMEIQPHLCMISHFYSSGVALMSERLWYALNEEERKLVVNSAVEAGVYQRAWFWDAEVALAKRLESEGLISITYPTDRDEWVKAVQPVYEKYFEQFPHWRSLVEQIRAME